MREILHTELLSPNAQAPAADADGFGSSEVRGRMELEHEVALAERAQLAVMRVAVDDLERVAASSAGGRIEPVLASLTSLVRALPRKGDLLAVRDQDQIVVVWTRTDASEAEKLARRLQQDSARLGIRLSIGLAVAQFDVPYWFQTLLAVAQEGVDVAWNSGGGRVIHSEIYSLHQRRLERLSPDRPKPVMPAERKRSEPPVLQEVVLPVAPPPPAPPPSAPSGGATARLATASPVRPLPPVPGFRDLEERVLTLAREWTEEALTKALAESHKAHSSEVDRLQRRIDKLSRTLEEAQEELLRARDGKEIDPGIASVYRKVQGLRDTNGSSAKREMLSKLFEANLELRTLLGQMG